MLAVYLFCAVFGGGLLLVSALDLFGASEADAGVFEPGHTATEFLSLRTVLYFLTGFGATGALLTLAGASLPISLGLSLGTGMAAGTLSALLYGWLRRSESGIVPMDSQHLVGLEGEVILPIAPDATGKIRVLSGNRALELLARAHIPQASLIMRGTPIVILEVVDGTALIAPATSLLPETP